jgi:Fic family protein
MADLEQFLTRTVMPAVVQAGIAHAQFETIHPFVDGNGRVGRALIHAVLRHRALSVKVPVPISAALLADRDGYLAALTAYQQHADVRTWLMRFAEACTAAACHGQELGDRLEELDMSRRGRDNAPRRGSHPHRLLDHLIAYPVLNAPGRQTARHRRATGPARS